MIEYYGYIITCYYRYALLFFTIVIVFYQYINGSMVILSLAIILMYLEFSNVL